MRLKLTAWPRRLWLKLIIFYALATMLALVAGILVNGLIESRWLRRQLRITQQTGRIRDRIAEDSRKIEPWLDPSSRNVPALMMWLEKKEAEIRVWQRSLAPYLLSDLNRVDLARQRNLLLVSDCQGIIIAGIGEAAGWKDQRVEDKLSPHILGPPNLAEWLEVYCREPERYTAIAAQYSADDSLIMIPIRYGQMRALGALFVKRIGPPDLDLTLVTFASNLLRNASAVILFAGLFGLLFGWLLSRSLCSRIDRIINAAEAWSRREFSEMVNDRSTDELGRLAERLNSMARELCEALALRQQLAASEERNRLARDLHDTAKQQIFALAMQLGTARALIERDDLNRTDDNGAPRITDQVKAHLQAAERLASQAQQDLVQVIRELKPAPADVGWPSGLRDYVLEWSRQSGIAAEIDCPEISSPPQDVQVAILRIVQEACANIARHSGARQVKITIKTGENDELLLTISDDGGGFDLRTVTPGMGLQNMRERAEALLGGWFKIVSQVEMGTRIEAGCKLSLSWPSKRSEK